MKTFQLKGYKRESVGSKTAKKYRKKSFIPCVLYGGKAEVVHFNVLKDSIFKLIYTSDTYIVELNIEEQFCLSILKETQFHPVTDEVLHMDFIRIDEKKSSVINIPVKLAGIAEGVKLGGKLLLVARKLKVRGLYKNFPEQLIINIENLGLGKTIRVGDLFFDNLDLLNAKDNPVVSVKLTRLSQTADEVGTKTVETVEQNTKI